MCYCKITLPLRHVVFIRLIGIMCGLFRGTEFRVAQSLFCEYQRAKIRQVVYT